MASFMCRALREEQQAAHWWESLKTKLHGCGKTQHKNSDKDLGNTKERQCIIKEKEIQRVLVDKASCTASQLSRLNWVYFPLQINKVGISINLSLLGISP